ncbi:hypothetical protein [Agrilutibacter solisilvae]|uniref:Transmembrane protein n=1 Tax=Agrilutibacter solisilvae TaxID=2763317 RepID=A0A974Y2G3_9GAMM|nr:hypothetical protein [Lysobacter solisilvae]QSX79370.1 hypothetical protein I8J32_005780 [Lysobacter solisilvae]
MRNCNWSNIVLGASLLPSGLLVGFICWYMFVFRPSGEEQWGDGVAIFYLGAVTYPLSIMLLAVGVVLSVRWRRNHPGQPTAGPLLFAASLGLLAAPWLLLLAQVR